MRKIDGSREPQQSDFTAHFPSVSRETLSRLATYETLLRQWQPTINLVAPNTLTDVWRRHFADSAQLLDLAPHEARTWIDLGSGAGFPGLVLAILLYDRNGARVTLVESDSRKAAFLREVARQTGAPVDIVNARIENLATQYRLAPMDVVTARALAPMPRLLELSHGLFGPDTIGLFPKGARVGQEIALALEDWSFTYDSVPSRTDAEARIVVVRAPKARNKGGTR